MLGEEGCTGYRVYIVVYEGAHSKTRVFLTTCERERER